VIAHGPTHHLAGEQVEDHGQVEPALAGRNVGVPLSFAPDEAYQFDWSHEVVLINGTTVTVSRSPRGRNRFATDSPLEGARFELSVPLEPRISR
jgi:hypothetical protein